MDSFWNRVDGLSRERETCWKRGGGKVSNNGTVDLSLVSSLRVLMELGDDRGAGALSVICCSGKL